MRVRTSSKLCGEGERIGDDADAVALGGAVGAGEGCGVEEVAERAGDDEIVALALEGRDELVATALTSPKAGPTALVVKPGIAEDSRGDGDEDVEERVVPAGRRIVRPRGGLDLLRTQRQSLATQRNYPATLLRVPLRRGRNKCR